MRKRKSPIILVTVLLVTVAVISGFNYTMGRNEKAEEQQKQTSSNEIQVDKPRPSTDSKSVANQVASQAGGGGGGGKSRGGPPKRPIDGWPWHGRGVAPRSRCRARWTTNRSRTTARSRASGTTPTAKRRPETRRLTRGGTISGPTTVLPSGVLSFEKPGSIGDLELAGLQDGFHGTVQQDPPLGEHEGPVG